MRSPYNIEEEFGELTLSKSLINDSESSFEKEVLNQKADMDWVDEIQELKVKLIQK